PRRSDGPAGLEVIPVLVPGRRRRPGHPARSRTPVRCPHGRHHHRGPDQPCRHGLPPRRSGAARRDSRPGGPGRMKPRQRFGSRKMSAQRTPASGLRSAGFLVMRSGLVTTLVWIGALNFTDYEIENAEVLVTASPLTSRLRKKLGARKLGWLTG